MTSRGECHIEAQKRPHCSLGSHHSRPVSRSFKVGSPLSLCTISDTLCCGRRRRKVPDPGKSDYLIQLRSADSTHRETHPCESPASAHRPCNPAPCYCQLQRRRFAAGAARRRERFFSCQLVKLPHVCILSRFAPTVATDDQRAEAQHFGGISAPAKPRMPLGAAATWNSRQAGHFENAVLRLLQVSCSAQQRGNAQLTHAATLERAPMAAEVRIAAIHEEKHMRLSTMRTWPRRR